MVHIAPSKPEKRRALVVEGSGCNSMLMAELLRVNDYEATCATTGFQALELLTDSAFDLIFVSAMLDDMDGIRLCQTYRFGCARPSPVVFLTADTSGPWTRDLLTAGGSHVIYAPYTLAAVTDVVGRLGRPAQHSDGPAVDQSATGAEAKVIGIKPTQKRALTIVPPVQIDADAIATIRAVTDRQFVDTWLATARTDLDQTAQALAQALAAGDRTATLAAAERLRSVCPSIGAVRLAKLAQRVLTSAHQDLVASRKQITDEILKEAKAAVTALAQIVASND